SRGWSDDVDLRAVLAHDAQSDRQAQPGSHSRGFGGEKWIEDARQDGLRYSWTVVLDLQQHAPFANSSGGQFDRSAVSLVFDGLLGISHEIHQNLLQVAGVAFHGRKR